MIHKTQSAPTVKTGDRFVFLTDLHLGPEHSWLEFKRVVDDIESMTPRPTFVIIGGDCVRLHEPNAQEAFARYSAMIDALSVPVYHVLGNHDIESADVAQPEAGKSLFIDRFGPRYQRIDWNDHVVLLLDVIMARPLTSPSSDAEMVSEIDEPQIAWLAEQLAQCKPGQTVLLVSHLALTDSSLEVEPGTKWGRVRSVLRDDLNYINLSGHTHQQTAWRDRDGLNWQTYVGGSLCGMWWRGSGYNIDSTRTGYNIVTCGDAGCRFYAKSPDQQYAVASPRFDRVYHQQVPVHWIDSHDGLERETTWQNDDAAGWVTLDTDAPSAPSDLTAFIVPPAARGRKLTEQGQLRLVIHKFLKESPLVVQVNHQTIATIQPHRLTDEPVTLALPAGLLADDWNVVEFNGNALINSVVLEVAGEAWVEPWIQRLLSRRDNGSIGRWEPFWDTSLTCPVTVSRWRRNSFYFARSSDADR